MTIARRILFICGSMNQTAHIGGISRHLTKYEQAFAPYHCDGVHEVMRRMRLVEFAFVGNKLAKPCHQHPAAQNLSIDYQGRCGLYDLGATCSDVFFQRNIRGTKTVLVQEGVTDPEGREFRLAQRHRRLPRWIAGTAATGLSEAYCTFCVASEGYRDFALACRTTLRRRISRACASA